MTVKAEMCNKRIEIFSTSEKKNVVPWARANKVFRRRQSSLTGNV